MLITLNIQAETPQELQQAIAGLASLNGVAASAPTGTTAPKSSRSTVKPQEPAKEADPVKDETAEPETTDTGSDEYVPTVIELRAKSSEVGTTPEGKKAIKALLDKYSSASLSNVPEDERAAFLADLGKIKV
jgi:hypothetical protein